MADVQKENGYFEFANEIAEALARVNLNAYQQRVLWVIWRKTYGWKKKSDRISRSQFVEMTAIEGRNIDRTIKQLEKMNIITVKRHATKTAVYSFQKNYDAWLLASNETQVKKTQLVSNESPACVSTDTKTCVSIDTHKRKKEIYKRNIARKLHDKESLSLFLSEKYPSLNALILEYVNKVRMANKSKSIAEKRAIKIVESLKAVAGKYGIDKMTKGIHAVFRKAEREGYNFSGHDPVGYVRAVAKGEKVKMLQQSTEAAHKQQKAALRAAPKSNFLNEIQQAVHS
jgi:phage replication O-like protein O